jgi:glycosyltransferase involved in cell wall biosynthesis
MHGISEFDYPAGLLLAEKIRAASFVACVSYFGRAQAMRLVDPEYWNKLHVVRCGLAFDALPRRPAAGRPTKRFISVGRLSPEKGQAGLLEAFASVCAKSPELELMLVGDGPEALRLKDMAGRLGIKDRVRFAGRCSEDEALRHIADSDVLVLSSFMEGLPIVLIEAMALGTAVIASRVAGIPELVEHESTGLLFTPSNWEELAGCMHRLVADDRLRNQCVKRGKDVVSASFDVLQSAAQLNALFAGEMAK